MANDKLAPSRPALIVVTGIQAAGKSTVGRRLAERFERGAYVEADALQGMIVSGCEWVRERGAMPAEAARQLRLRLANMCLIGLSFYRAGFSVVMDDIIIGDRWEHLTADLADVPFQLVVLAPRVDVVVARDLARHRTTVGEAWADYLDTRLRATMTGRGLWIDSSDELPDETVERVVVGLGLRP